MKKYSIHIGVNEASSEHYGGALEALASCHNDAKAMQSVAKHLGFEESKLFLDQEACAEPIKDALKAYADILQKGDLLMISYSGHGGFIPNFNDEEDEEEHGDQTWCLYDRQLIDDELGHIWPLFQEGVKILVFLDACHSGTAVRDHMSVANPASQVISKEKEEELEAFFEEENAVTKALPAFAETSLYFKFKDLYDEVIAAHQSQPNEMKASLLLFAACQDDQEARAGSSYSYFTLAFIQVMMRRAQQVRNYKDLFSMLQQQALPTQTPNEYYLGEDKSYFLENIPFLLPEEKYPNDIRQFFQQLKRLRFE